MRLTNNHFTRKLLLTLGVIVCAQAGALAQTLWEEGRNIAGEAAGAGLGHSADASIGAKYTSGNFRSPSMGKTLITGAAEAAAVSSFEDIYLKGNFGFELVRGTDMMGSMFSEPGFYPVDVLEFTPGIKIKQTYSIGGGFAWKNSSRWTPGITLDFQGVNYAKRKDLRHTTYRQVFEAVPSVHYRGDQVQLGLSAILGKNSEFIQAEQVGQAKAEPYMAFLDKGMRYGSMQVWDGSGTHLKEPGVDRFPVKQYTGGAALQTSVGTFLYGDLEYRYSRGEVGEKGYTWFIFPGHTFEGKIIGTIRRESATHIIRADGSFNYLENYETVIEKVTDGGVSTPVVYGSNRIYRHEGYSASLSYRFMHRRGWMAGTSVEFEGNWDMGTLMYPYYDDDRSRHLRWAVMGMVPLGKRFILRGGGTFICKIGEHTHVVDVADPSIGITSTPYRLQDWWDREQEAADATRFLLNAALRFNFGPGLYVEAGCAWLHGFEIKLLSGSDRQTSYLKFGYNF